MENRKVTINKIVLPTGRKGYGVLIGGKQVAYVGSKQTAEAIESYLLTLNALDYNLLPTIAASVGISPYL
jgi:archaellum biogenesis ATPase FlaH